MSFVGEYPFWSLDLLGSERVYKALIVKLTQPEHFVNSQTGAEMDCRLFTLTGKGAAKGVSVRCGFPVCAFCTHGWEWRQAIKDYERPQLERADS